MGENNTLNRGCLNPGIESSHIDMALLIQVPLVSVLEAHSRGLLRYF